MKLSRLGLGALGVVMVATVAWAGTKFQTSIVPATNTNPTLSEKSKLKIVDKGALSAKIQGVTDGAGMLVTGDGSFDGKSQTGMLTGDEYAVILKGTFVALGQPFEFVLVTDLKNGKGSMKTDAASLFALIPGGLHRASDMGTVEVWGPIGDQVCDDIGTGTCQGGTPCTTNADCPPLTGGVGSNSCELLLTAGFDIDGENSCKGGEKIGIGGLLIP